MRTSRAGSLDAPSSAAFLNGGVLKSVRQRGVRDPGILRDQSPRQDYESILAVDRLHSTRSAVDIFQCVESGVDHVSEVEVPTVIDIHCVERRYLDECEPMPQSAILTDCEVAFVGVHPRRLGENER